MSITLCVNMTLENILHSITFIKFLIVYIYAHIIKKRLENELNALFIIEQHLILLREANVFNLWLQ